jgi:uncharacterized BrkB/YihY/UPF0761 family membrane protein
MKWFVLTFILFFLLTPGILLRLPPNGNKWVVASVHGVVLAIILWVACKYYKSYLEGFKGGALYPAALA